MTDDLPPSVRALIDAERDAPTGTEPLQSSIRARIAVTVGVAAAGAAAAAGTSSAATTAGAAATMTAGKLVALVLAVGVLGGGAVALVRHVASGEAERPTSIEVPVPVARSALMAPETTTSMTPAPPPAPLATPSAALPSRVAAPSPSPSPSPSPPPATPAQAELLSDASAALAREDTDAALDLLARDAQLHATGALAEERDALRVEALLAAGRAAEARAAARAFRAAYPNSIHHHVVELADKESAP